MQLLRSIIKNWRDSLIDYEWGYNGTHRMQTEEATENI